MEVVPIAVFLQKKAFDPKLDMCVRGPGALFSSKFDKCIFRCGGPIMYFQRLRHSPAPPIILVGAILKSLVNFPFLRLLFLLCLLLLCRKLAFFFLHGLLFFASESSSFFFFTASCAAFLAASALAFVTAIASSFAFSSRPFFN